MGSDAAAGRFLNTVAPLLAARKLFRVTDVLENRWPSERLVDFLSSASCEVIRTAATCLGLTGSMSHCEPIALLLRHRDPSVYRVAENTLWRIWMRGGSSSGNERLARAVASIAAEDYCEADRTLTLLSADEPLFAECHHQHAIALWFLDRLEEAAFSFGCTCKMNRCHFAAAAGLGHVHAQRADARGALRHYRAALEIYPHLDELRDAVATIEAALQRRRPAAG